MLGLTPREEFQGRLLEGTAIGLANENNTGATQIPAFKVRGQSRFRRQDLDSWMASQVASASTLEQPVKTDAAQRRPRRRRGEGK